MSTTTNVDSNYEIDMFLPVIGRNGEVEIGEKNSVNRCKSARNRENEGTIIVQAYNGGKPEKNKVTEQEK